MNPSSNIVLVGPTGAGKSSIGRMLAPPLGLTALDLDREIEKRVGAPIKAMFDERGEDYFRDRESETLEAVLQGTGILLATGAGCVLRARNRDIMKRLGFVIHIDVSVNEQIRRLQRDQTRPLLQLPNREAILREMAEVRGPWYRDVADLRFCNDVERSAKGSCAQLMTQLQPVWTRP